MPFYDDDSSSSSHSSSHSNSSNSGRTSRATGHWIFFSPPPPPPPPLSPSASSPSSSSSSSSSSSPSSPSSPPPLPPRPEERIRQYEEAMDEIYERLLMRQSAIRRARRADLIRWLEDRSWLDRGLYFLLLHRVEALEEEYRESQRSLLEKLRAMTPAQLQARLEEARDMSPRWWPAKAWLP